jgi:hypothetical protein
MGEGWVMLIVELPAVSSTGRDVLRRSASRWWAGG